MKLKTISFFTIVIFIINIVMPVVLAVDEINNEVSNSEVKEDVNSSSTATPEVDKNEEIDSPSPSPEIDNENDNKIEQNIPSISSTPQPSSTIEENRELKSEEEIMTTNLEDEIQPIATGTKTIENGLYKIRSALSSYTYLDISGGSKSNNANLQIWQNEYVDQQYFQVSYLNNGYYRITAMHSNKALDVAGAGKRKGTNVAQYTSNGTDAQQWVIKAVGNNYYTIISRCNGLALDVNGASRKNGTNVQVYTLNGSSAQKFRFERVEPPIKNGIYKIRSGVSSSKYLDISGGSVKDGANLQIWQNSNVGNQRFRVEYLNNGYYRITAIHSNKVLDVSGAGLANGTNVAQYTSNGTDAQQWVIRYVGNGFYSIISKCNGLYLDVAGGSTSSGANVQMYSTNGTNSQRFMFEESDNVTNPIISDGTYRITTALASNMALDIDGGSKLPGANVQIWSSTNVLQQKFRLKHIGSNYYTIEVVHSNMALEVSGNNVIQNYKTNSDAQKWLLEDAGNGYYYIKSKSTGLMLDIAGAGKNEGNNVQVAEKNQTDAQKFKIEEVYFGIDVSTHNGTIDFNQLANSGQVEYMISRAGWYSSSKHQFNLDNQFERNYTQAKQRNIPIGTYLYSYATNDQEARDEANALVSYLRSRGMNFDLPVFLDIEDPKYQASLSRQQKTNICLIFGQILKSAGYKVGIYSSKSWLLTQIDMSQIPSDYSIWVAAWGVNNGNVPDDIYKYLGNHDIWQYSSRGIVGGISGYVDVNITFKRMF